MKKPLLKLFLHYKKQLVNISASLFFAFIIVVLVAIVANIFYRTKISHKRGFFIEFTDNGKPIIKEPEKIPDLNELLASADFSRGEKIFKKCSSCHNINQGEGAKVGPNLYGVIARKKASALGFAYSEALIAKGGVWSKEEINQFITKPKNYIAGTKMAFAGLKKPQDRADVILYLEKKSTN
jgi:cytochrome c